jgi:hypothetical protein
MKGFVGKKKKKTSCRNPWELNLCSLHGLYPKCRDNIRNIKYKEYFLSLFMKCKNFKILGILGITKTSFFHINKYFGITFFSINYRYGSDSILTQGQMAQKCELMHLNVS